MMKDISTESLYWGVSQQSPSLYYKINQTVSFCLKTQLCKNFTEIKYSPKFGCSKKIFPNIQCQVFKLASFWYPLFRISPQKFDPKNIEVQLSALLLCLLLLELFSHQFFWAPSVFCHYTIWVNCKCKTDMQQFACEPQNTPQNFMKILLCWLDSNISLFTWNSLYFAL